jgi:hypothetical protein
MYISIIHEYIAKHTKNFDAIKASSARYSPESVSAICGIEAKLIAPITIITLENCASLNGLDTAPKPIPSNKALYCINKLVRNESIPIDLQLIMFD